LAQPAAPAAHPVRQALQVGADLHVPRAGDKSSRVAGVAGFELFLDNVNPISGRHARPSCCRSATPLSSAMRASEFDFRGVKTKSRA
jgi:hypothetical protein